LKQFGGHVKAAGFTMDPAEYDHFLECFNEYLTENFIAPELDAPLLYDAECTLDELNIENWQKVESLLPWGQQNPEPVLLVKGVSYSDFTAFGIDNGSEHLPRDNKVECLIMWRSQNQIRITRVL
jgi:single-stranded-DNA-specific exonuclease